MKRTRALLAAGCASLLLVLACAAPERPAPVPLPPPKPATRAELPPPPEPAPPPEVPVPRVDEGVVARAFRDGDYGTVVSEFERILHRFPSHIRGKDDLYYLGMSYFYLERNSLALKTLLEFQYRFHDDPRIAEVHFVVAKLFRRLGRPERSLDSLRQAIHLAADDTLRLEAWVEKADILAGQGRYLESLTVLDEAYLRSQGKEREEALARVRDLLRIMPAETTARIMRHWGYSLPRKEAEILLPQERGGGDFAVEPPLAPGVERAEDRPLVKIAVLAPAAGRLEAYGRELVRGVDLLLESAAAEGLPPDVEKIFLEEGAESDEALLLDQAVRSDDILVVIGPLLSSTVEKVVSVAERESLGVLSPTASSARLNGISPNFFRNCLTLEESGKALAEFAVNVLGLRTFVIFTPDDAYGFHYADIFQREVSAHGAEVLATQEYDVELTDFTTPIKALKAKTGVPERVPGEEEGKEGKKGEAAEEGFVLPFEAIFFPGSAEEVGLILPQFAFHDMDVRRLAVLGGSGLNTPRLPEVGEEFAEGAFFTDGFFAGSPRLPVQRFVTLYRQRYGDLPGTFAAQAYDAAAMVLELFRRGADTRAKMLRALAEVRDFTGVTGRTSLFPGGRSSREPIFGTVLRGGLVSVELLGVEDSPSPAVPLWGPLP